MPNFFRFRRLCKQTLATGDDILHVFGVLDKRSSEYDGRHSALVELLIVHGSTHNTSHSDSTDAHQFAMGYLDSHFMFCYTYDNRISNRPEPFKFQCDATVV